MTIPMETKKTVQAKKEADPAKLKQLSIAVETLERQFGKGAIMRLGDKEAVMPVQVVSTGSVALDFALGVG